MTTFTGQETVNSVVRIATSSSGTIYTVPANTYAKVYIESVLLSASSSIVIGQLTFTSGGGTSTLLTTSIGVVSANATSGNIEPLRDIVLYTGQTIVNSSSSACYMTIIEHPIP